MWCLCIALYAPVAAQVPGPLLPGRHNTDPITACVNYNPAELIFTTAPSGGQPPYAFQWQLGRSAAGPWTDIAGATAMSYDPPNLMEAGTWCFRCKVTDDGGLGVFTAFKKITIVPDPVVTVTGGGVACGNNGATFEATVTGGTGTISWQWQSSYDGLTGWSSIAGAASPVYVWVTSAAGLFFFRCHVSATGAACSSPYSAVVPLLVIPDTVPPRLTAPPGPFHFCVEKIGYAWYSTPSGEVIIDLPEYFLFRSGDRFFDLDSTTFTDNCCPAGSLTIHWRIDFQGGTPAPVFGTGQPSEYPGDIRFEADTITYGIAVHTITWWLTDCNGVESVPQTAEILITPRPRIYHN